MLFKAPFGWLHITSMLSLNRKSCALEPAITATLYSGHLSTTALYPLTCTLMTNDLRITATIVKRSFLAGPWVKLGGRH